MRFLVAFVTCIAALAVAPAFGATHNVKIDDDFYDPTSTTAAVGETVNWHWNGFNDHSVTANRIQIDKFDSGINSKGHQFSHLFKYAGRFRYFCQVHPDVMRATVTVGTDDGIAPKITKVKRKVSGHTVKLSFRLSERSVVTVKVKKKKVVKTLGAGKHGIRFKHLASGDYKARFSAKDGFGHKGTKSKRFTIG